jgi:thiol:disulfide interchange protein DsbD
LLALRAAGHAIGWGFQLQQPAFVLFLAYVMTAIALNLAGLYAIPGISIGAATSEGMRGSFVTGALVVVVATPCTAPFMAGALGYALLAPAWEALAILAALGVGLASPLLAIGFVPRLARFVPPPGIWMVTLRRILALPMAAAAAWLLWVLARQAPDASVTALLGIGLVVVICWLVGGRQRIANLARHVLLGAAVALAIVPLVLAERAPPPPRSDRRDPEGLASLPFSRQAVADLRRDGRTVFVNVTADWCLSCIVNERVVLADPAIAQAFAAKRVAYVKADWTRRDPAITALLREHGHAGVPLYVVLPAREGLPPRVLPQILTTGIVLEALATK